MLSYLVNAVRQCGPVLLEAEEIGRNVAEKDGPRNFVTAYDVKVQAMLREQLLSRWPDAHFVGEEGDCQDDARHGLAFIVDPIDGTTNFIKGYRASAISVAAAQDGQTICGVVYDPYTDSLFTAERGRGAWLNDRPIQVSKRGLAEGLVCLGTALYYPEERDRTFALARALFDASLDLRRSGSAALDLCYVACGRAELMTEARLCPWDYAAAGLIVTEAGGCISDLSGQPLPLDRKSSVLAGTPRAYCEFFQKGMDRL